jgi:hypothetical protein
MPLEQGQVINDRYRIAHLISESRYGALYRAWDLQNQNPCALKERLDPNLVERELFRNEAARLINLDHPRLARLYDFFSIPGQGEYLVSEFVEGEDLGSFQENARKAGMARLSEAQVVPWLMQAGEALAYLHSQNPPILHGDIKPANLRLTPQGEIFLVGLGFSHQAGPQARSVAGREVNPGYSAPEQYGATALDPRSDVYAMGAVLYALLTGVTPPDSVDLMTGAASLAPARQLNPLISPDMDRLIQQSMQGNRNARLPDMRAFSNALAADYSRIMAAPVKTASLLEGATVATAAAVATVASGAGGLPPAPDAGPAVQSPAEAGGERRTIQMLILAIAGVALVCVIVVSLWFLLSNRGSADQAEVIGTQSAQTLEAQITLYAAQTAAALQTVVVTTPPGTASPLPPTETVSPQAPTPTRAACEKASFVSDVTVPDNTVMNPNTPFAKTWRIRNDSQCTWTSKYALVFAGGTQMSSQNSVPFPGQVPPGQTVDLSVNMQAPLGPGAVQSNWLLRSPENVTFGVGAGGDNPLFVRIWVTTPVQPDARFAYDFTANYCNAQWRTNAGVISCNNISSDPRGSTLVLANAPLERAQENEPGLWVRPDQNSNGFIVGEYPNYTINPGDHFVTELGCVQSSTGCDVSFQLDMQVQGGSLINLGVWNEVYDGKTRIVDLDLKPYYGQTVRFLLRMVANGQVAQANGVWFLPSIRNQPVAPTVTLPPTVTPTSGVTPYP